MVTGFYITLKFWNASNRLKALLKRFFRTPPEAYPPGAKLFRVVNRPPTLVSGLLTCEKTTVFESGHRFAP